MTERINSSNGTLHIIPFSQAHVCAFTHWFNALPHNDVWTEESVLYKSVQDEAYDPALMLAVEDEGEPVGFLLGSIANEAGWIRAFLVRPDHQRQGIGTILFDAIEHALAERGISQINVGWALPKFFLPGVDIGHTSAIVFLDRRGYQASRETRVNMDVVLSGRSFDTASREAYLWNRTHLSHVSRSAVTPLNGRSKGFRFHCAPERSSGRCECPSDLVLGLGAEIAQIVHGPSLNPRLQQIAFHAPLPAQFECRERALSSQTTYRQFVQSQVLGHLGDRHD